MGTGIVKIINLCFNNGLNVYAQHIGDHEPLGDTYLCFCKGKLWISLNHVNQRYCIGYLLHKCDGSAT